MKTIVIAIITSLYISINAQTWYPLGSGISLSSGSEINALGVYNGEIYAGGTFTAAGGNAASNIAKWNGSTWSPLSTGISGKVYAIVVYNGELYAGGIFNNAGGSSAAYIAKWNGSTWASVGGGLGFCSTCTGPTGVHSLAVYNGELYVGGGFSLAGTIPVNNIAKWNGTTWSAVGAGITGNSMATVYALAVYNNELYAGGAFTGAGGGSAQNMAKWNGTAWSQVGCNNGMNDFVFSLADYNANLYTGGAFGYICSQSKPKIARWSGSAFSTLGSGVTNQDVHALHVFNNKLFIGGLFSTAGGISANHIACWNGTSWSALGSGCNGIVESFTSDNTSLYVGGTFTAAGGVTANKIARWVESLSGVKEIDSSPILSIAPNPFYNETIISFNRTLEQSTLELIDLLGKNVKTIFFSGNQLTIEKGSLNEGVYFLRIAENDQTISTTKIIIQ